MTTPFTKKSRVNLALLALAAAFSVFATGFALGRDREVPADVDATSVLVCEQGGFRYEYHVPTGTETLYDASSKDLVNVIGDHRGAADACRRSLEKRCGVADLADLRARYDESIRRLNSMGYL